VRRPFTFATVEMSFGGEGSGQGLFEDARYIGADGEGNIYVGDYFDGRIQVFDASGKFLALWMFERQNPDVPLLSMAVDRQGTVYLANEGEISRFEGKSGNFLGQVEWDEDHYFQDVAVTADGGLLAASRIFSDDLLRFDPQGNLLWAVQDAISEQSGDPELDMKLAADGLGNIYALGSFNNAVFKFTPEGKYVTRFGSEGDEPGQLHAPLDIAVDGYGRVYVSDYKGIQVFDTDGRYLELIRVSGAVFGMAFSGQNELLAVTNQQKVLKYLVGEP